MDRTFRDPLRIRHMDVEVRQSRSAVAFRLHDWLVEPSRNRLSRGSTVVQLRPKVMDTLTFLAARPGEVVPRERIIDAVWAKEYIADTALSRAIFELREALGDDPQKARYVETIPKRGYRLVAPVEPVGEAPAGAAIAIRRRLLRPRLVLLAVAVAVLPVAVTLLVAPRSPGAADTWSSKIVVLPFENLGASEDEYFAAGLTDEVTSRLAGVSGLGVVAPASGGAARRPGRTAREIGEELGADHVLEGAVRWQRAGDRARVRITPKLLRVADGTVLWAEAYDREIGDALTVQAEIADAVTARLGMAIEGGSAGRGGAAPTASIDAYQAYLRGRYHEGRPDLTRRSLRVAVEMYQRAVAIDPGFDQAYARLAIAGAKLYHHAGDSEPEHREVASAALTHARSLAGDAPLVHLAAGLFHYWCERDYERATAELRAARAGLAGSPELLQAEAWVLRRRGDWDAALARFAAAERLDPRDSRLLLEAGIARSFVRNYEDADATFARAIAIAPDEPYLYLYRALNRVSWNGDAPAALAGLSPTALADDLVVAFDVVWLHVLAGRYRPALDLLAPISEPIAFTSYDCKVKPLLAALALQALGSLDGARDSFLAARSLLAGRIATAPGNYRLHSALAFALAGLGERAAAVAAARRAVELCPLERDAVSCAWQRANLATVRAMLGDADGACQDLAELLVMPSPISLPLVRIDPRWDRVRDEPCLQALLVSPEK